MPLRPRLLLGCALLLGACGENPSAERAPETPIDSAAATLAVAAATDTAEARLLSAAGFSLLQTERGFALLSEQTGQRTELASRPVFSPNAERLALAGAGGVEIWRVQDGVPVREWSSGPTPALAGPPRWQDATTLTLPSDAGTTLLVTNPGPGWMLLEPAG